MMEQYINGHLSEASQARATDFENKHLYGTHSLSPAPAQAEREKAAPKETETNESASDGKD